MEGITKSKSDRSRSFKQKGIDVNKRSLRIHRRSLDWRANRQDDVNRRRNLSGMSPLQEVTSVLNTDISSHEHVDAKEQKTTIGTPKLSRADKLKKWKAEKDLKKNIEKIEHSKKQVFKVKHVKQEEYEKVTDNLFKAKVAGNIQLPSQPKKKVAPPTVRRSARLAEGQPKTEKDKPKVAAKKSTKSAAAAKKNAKPVIEKKESQIQAKTDNPQKDFITHMRGNRLLNEQESFAPNDFSFIAPTNLKPFTFKPLSPSSANKFLLDPKGLSALQTPPTRGSSTPLRFSAKGNKMVRSPPRLAESLNASGIDKEPTEEIPEVILDTFSKEPDVPGQLEQIPEEVPMETVNTAEENSFLSPNCMNRSASSSRKRSRSANAALSARKTPKALRNSLILQTLSPEESVEILAKSPMIEMKRRTPKSSATIGHIPIEPILNFDEAIEEEEHNLQTGSAKEVEARSINAQDLNEINEKKQDLEKTDNGEQDVKTGNIEEKPEKNSIDAETVNTEAIHDVPYFRNLVVEETGKLNNLSDKWEAVNQEKLSEEVKGQIRTTIGQAKLLIAQRFKQFLGLVDNCEQKTGEKEIGCTDLQGFWDMVYYQVEDVHIKFDDLTKLQANDWILDEPKKKPVKKVIKKKVAAVKGTAKPKVKSSFAAFRAKMKQQQEQPEKATLAVVPPSEEGTITFEGGFFAVCSPCKSPRAHNNCQAATPNRNSLGIEESQLSSKKNLAPMSSPFLSVVPHKSLATKSGVTSPSTLNDLEENKLTELKDSLSCTPQIVVRAVEPDQETPRRRSSRKRSLSAPIFEKSAKKQERQPESIITEEIKSNENEESMETGTNPFEMYLKPANTQNVEDTPRQVSLDTSDIFSQGSSPAIRVFGATYSGKKSHRPSPYGVRRLSSSEKIDGRTTAGRARNRRSVSVKFTPNAKTQKECSMRIPGTPYNKDSLEPVTHSNPGKRRTSQRMSNISNMGDSLLFSPAAESPASKMEKLSVNSTTPAEPLIKPRRVSELLYTPPTGRRSPRFSPITEKNAASDLMSFSPV